MKKEDSWILKMKQWDAKEKSDENFKYKFRHWVEGRKTDLVLGGPCYNWDSL